MHSSPKLVCAGQPSLDSRTRTQLEQWLMATSTKTISMTVQEESKLLQVLPSQEKKKRQLRRNQRTRPSPKVCPCHSFVCLASPPPVIHDAPAQQQQNAVIPHSCYMRDMLVTLCMLFLSKNRSAVQILVAKLCTTTHHATAEFCLKVGRSLPCISNICSQQCTCVCRGC